MKARRRNKELYAVSIHRHKRTHNNCVHVDFYMCISEMNAFIVMQFSS